MDQPKSRIKTGMKFSILGALAALSLASIFLPGLMVWYFEPPVNPGYSCAPSIQKALDLFRIAQAVTLFFGGIFGFIFALRWTKKPAAKSEPPSP
ncbi:MAG: hypothetical protein KGP28_07290 [Bdellovibrionales bacterium]|nr:hypothetical protein [Bdellovibrionales bacterium]